MGSRSSSRQHPSNNAPYCIKLLNYVGFTKNQQSGRPNMFQPVRYIFLVSPGSSFNSLAFCLPFSTFSSPFNFTFIPPFIPC